MLVVVQNTGESDEPQNQNTYHSRQMDKQIAYGDTYVVTYAKFCPQTWVT